MEAMFDLPPLPEPEKLSLARRRTLANNGMLDRGIHPATGRPLKGGDQTCGDCFHHKARTHNRSWHKCELHRLGLSGSEASDIRVSWPACALFDPSGGS